MNPPDQQDGNVLGPATASQGAPQLPPQMFTTAAQLLDLTDSRLFPCLVSVAFRIIMLNIFSILAEKLMLVLRDGRKLIGVLRSWDQFANLVLADTKERYYVEAPVSDGPPRKLFCDIPRGTYLVRGENVLMLGEIDLDRDDEDPPGYVEGPVEEVFGIQKRLEIERKQKDKSNQRKAGEFWGGELEGSGEVLF